jgi:hypothetical protein
MKIQILLHMLSEVCLVVTLASMGLLDLDRLQESCVPESGILFLF